MTQCSHDGVQSLVCILISASVVLVDGLLGVLSVLAQHADFPAPAGWPQGPWTTRGRTCTTRRARRRRGGSSARPPGSHWCARSVAPPTCALCSASLMLAWVTVDPSRGSCWLLLACSADVGLSEPVLERP